MKKFTWRLQRLLDIKNIEEKCKMMELAKVTKILEETEMMIIKHKRVLEQIISEISQKNTDDRLRMQEFFMKYSRESDEIIKKLIQKMAELQDERKKKLEELIEVKRYRKGLEKLKEQAKTTFTQEQERQDQKQLDDDASMRIARKILVKN
jgi:flagellar FliJ protein